LQQAGVFKVSTFPIILKVTKLIHFTQGCKIDEAITVNSDGTAIYTAAQK